MLAQRGQSTSACSGIRPGSCKIEWRDEAGLIGPESRARRSGRRFIRKKRRSADCSARRGFWVGAKRNGITLPTNNLSRYDIEISDPSLVNERYRLPETVIIQICT